MGSSRILTILLLSCFLFLFLSPAANGAEVMGFGMKDAGFFGPLKVGKSRKLVVDIADYPGTGANEPGRTPFRPPSIH